jgi:predicted Zn-dependent protease
MGEKSLALEPDNSQLLGSLMEAYRAKGDKAKAAEYEKKYIAANPDQPDVIYNQAVELYNKGKFKEAEPLLLKVVEAKADHAKAHYLLGMCYVNLNKIPEMKKHLGEYLKLDPKGSDAAAAKEMIDAFK